MSVKISIISPVYKAFNTLDELEGRIRNSVEAITSDYEIILVDDGCPENSWEKIENLTRLNPKVVGIKLSRNFGQHHAITAGLDHAKGDWIVVMDCDLQDRPEEIPNLYQKASEGFDIVFARRVNRQDGFFKKLSSKLFYMAFSYLSGIKQDGTVANFGIYSVKVINVIKNIREPMRAFNPMVKWVGFKSTSIDVVHGERFEGKTSYNWKKLINLALDIALAYSDKPLKLTIRLGVSLSLLAFIFAMISIIRFYIGDITISGYTSLIVSIWFLSGLIIFILGIVGLYISKIFDGIKARPLYIIEKTTI